ncbi:MAG: FecR domain-containing protein [Betaproteobacteria bacterium]|nr:FecR domain-containing protein [Betaproteobacteria bacterium]
MRHFVAVAVLALAATGLARADDVGQVKVAKGTVHVERDGQRLPAAVGMPIRQSDTLITGADGSAGVTFSDNSLLSTGPNSVLVVEHYAFNSTTHAGTFDASLKKGTLAVVSGKIVKQSPGAMRVRTPAAIMGVRGTEFLVQVDEPVK